MSPCCQSTWGWGGNALCLAVPCQTVQQPSARMWDRLPPGVAVRDGLVARRLQHQRLPLLRPRRGWAATYVPDVAVPAACGVPRVARVALWPLYASRDLRRAVVVDKTLPAVCQ